MPRALQYILLFLAAALLQLLLLGNLNISIYVHPLFYLAFLILLPMELAPVWVLLSGFVMGVAMDITSASAGLNSAAILVSAFARPVFLQLAISKEDMREGGVPTSAKLGTMGFLRYSFTLILVHCFIYFTLEAATWSYYYLTLIRIVLSAVVTTGLVWLCQLFFIRR